MRSTLALALLLIACEGEAAAPPPAKTTVATSPPSQTPKAPSNPNKIVVGGENINPQMGLFALTAKDATRVDRTKPAKASYELAMTLAKKKWAGDRGFCEDAVRMTIGFYSRSGLLDANERKAWANANFEDVKKEHMAAINKLHEEMINESKPELCERTLRDFVEALNYISQNDLEVRNFVY